MLAGFYSSYRRQTDAARIRPGLGKTSDRRECAEARRSQYSPKHQPTSRKPKRRPLFQRGVVVVNKIRDVRVEDCKQRKAHFYTKLSDGPKMGL